MRTKQRTFDRDLDGGRARRSDRLGRDRPRPRRADLRRVADRRRGRLVRDRVPLLRALHPVQGPRRRRQARDARRAPEQRHGLPADRPARAVRPPLRRDRRRRPARRPRARRPDGLPAGDDLDHRRRHLRRRGAGHGRPVLLDAPRRQEPRADGARRDRAGRRRRRAGRRAVDHGDPARGPRARRRQRAGQLAVGHVQHRDDDPDRVLDGLLHARDPARARARDDARSA